MSRWLIAGLALASMVAACGPGSSPNAVETPAAERPGNVVVYDRIENLTDCAALQEEFDTAEAGPARPWKVPYMEAADARMQELGCYD